MVRDKNREWLNSLFIGSIGAAHYFNGSYQDALNSFSHLIAEWDRIYDESSDIIKGQYYYFLGASKARLNYPIESWCNDLKDAYYNGWRSRVDDWKPDRRKCPY